MMHMMKHSNKENVSGFFVEPMISFSFYNRYNNLLHPRKNNQYFHADVAPVYRIQSGTGIHCYNNNYADPFAPGGKVRKRTHLSNTASNRCKTVGKLPLIKVTTN